MPSRHLPIKLDTTSNGEFAPVPLPRDALAARVAAHAALDEGARRVGLDRRRYLAGLLGAAATLAAFNRAWAAAGKTGGGYALPTQAPYELAAAEAALAGDEFIFDVQLHHVNPRGAWRSHPGADRFVTGFPNARCGESDPVECFSSGALLKDVFMDSDTAMGVLSHVPGGMDANPLDFEAAGATRDAAHALDGTERLLLHGRCMPTLAGELDGMSAQAARFPVAAFKTYTQFGPPGGPAGFFLDDDRYGTPFIERARSLGVHRIAVHKGLPFGRRGYEYSLARDIGPAARRHPDMTFLVYHAGFDTGVKEGPYDPRASAGVDVLIRSLREAGSPRNVVAELGSTWRFVMRDPDQAAHLLGKLLQAFGEDHILWGTDSIWYGSPQDQIQAFRAFQIAPALQEKHGYPALTPAVKRKIFGLNAARVYGLAPDALRARLAKDPVQRRKSEYRQDPQPSFATYGPRTWPEFVALRRMQGGMP
jgi:hypothetical protein